MTRQVAHYSPLCWGAFGCLEADLCKRGTLLSNDGGYERNVTRQHMTWVCLSLDQCSAGLATTGAHNHTEYKGLCSVFYIKIIIMSVVSCCAVCLPLFFHRPKPWPRGECQDASGTVVTLALLAPSYSYFVFGEWHLAHLSPPCFLCRFYPVFCCKNKWIYCSAPWPLRPPKMHQLRFYIKEARSLTSFIYLLIYLYIYLLHFHMC